LVVIWDHHDDRPDCDVISRRIHFPAYKIADVEACHLDHHTVVVTPALCNSTPSVESSFGKDKDSKRANDTTDRAREARLPLVSEG
jgi:hypothetical protein